MKPVDLREFARRWEGGCLIRIYPVCNEAPTFLAHYRVANVAGGSQKPPDPCGAICCYACHELIDRRQYDRRFNGETLARIMLEGIVRTHAEYSKLMELVTKEDLERERDSNRVLRQRLREAEQAARKVLQRQVPSGVAPNA